MSATRAPVRSRGFDRPRFIWLVVAAVLVFLFLPIVVVVLFSFNSADSLVVFDSFSATWYDRLLADGDLLGSLWFSVKVAVASTAISTVLGTLLALGVQRASRTPARVTDGAIVLRLVAPETATAVALLILFTQLSIPLSAGTIIAAHVALTLVFVTVVVRSRLSSLGSEVEDAAMDLGATRLQAVWLVVIPVLRPAILSGALLSFVLSFDNFITSFFTTGIGTQPLPVRIYSMLKFGVTPVVNAAGVLMLVVIAVVLALGAVAAWLASRRSSRAAVAVGRPAAAGGDRAP